MHRRGTIGVLLVIAIAAFGLAWRSWHATRVRLSASADAGNEISRLKKRLADLDNAREPEAKKAETKSTKASVKKTLTEMGAEISAEARKRTEVYRAELLVNPTLQTLYEQNERARYSAMFAALFHRLKLAPEQRERFIEALVKNQMQKQDLEAIAKTKGLSRDDPQLQAERAASDAEVVREIEALLGPDGLAVTREYTRLETVRGYLAGYAGLFSRVGEPITVDQLERLTEVFGKAASKTALYRFTSGQWEQIWADAPRILTPEQWRYFQTITPPGQTASRWESAAVEILTKTAGPGPQ